MKTSKHLVREESKTLTADGQGRLKALKRGRREIQYCKVEFKTNQNLKKNKKNEYRLNEERRNEVKIARDKVLFGGARNRSVNTGLRGEMSADSRSFKHRSEGVGTKEEKKQKKGQGQMNKIGEKVTATPARQHCGKKNAKAVSRKDETESTFTK